MILDADALEKALTARLEAEPSLARPGMVVEGVEIALVVLGSLLLARRLARLLAGAPSWRPIGPPERARWGLLDVGALVLAYAFAAEGAVAVSARLAIPGPFGQEILPSILSLALAAIAAWVLATANGQGRRALGLTRGRYGAPISLLVGVSSFLVTLPLFVIANVASIAAFDEAGVPRDLNRSAACIVQSESGVEVATLLLFAVVIAPLCEEVIFRGFLHGGLRRYLGPHGASAVSALLFALVHPAPDRLAILVLAIGLSHAYERAGSLLAPVVMHACTNLLGVAILLAQRHIFFG